MMSQPKKYKPLKKKMKENKFKEKRKGGEIIGREKGNRTKQKNIK